VDFSSQMHNKEKSWLKVKDNLLMKDAEKLLNSRKKFASQKIQITQRHLL